MILKTLLIIAIIDIVYYLVVETENFAEALRKGKDGIVIFEDEKMSLTRARVIYTLDTGLKFFVVAFLLHFGFFV